MIYYFALAIYVVVCMVLMLVVLLQQGKGGDIANAFGGGSSQSAFGARSGATVLSRATTVCAVLFMVGALALGILGQRGPGSVVGGRAPLAAPGATPVAPPATPANPLVQPSTPAPPVTPSNPAQAGTPGVPSGTPAPAK